MDCSSLIQLIRPKGNTHASIDLLTDTAAILKLSDLRSIMGYPGVTPSVFTRYTRFSGGKENFNVYFSGKRRSLLNPKTAQRFFLFFITIIWLEKSARK